MGGGAGKTSCLSYDLQRDRSRKNRDQRSSGIDPSLVPTREEIGENAIGRGVSLLIGDGLGESEIVGKNESPRLCPKRRIEKLREEKRKMCEIHRVFTRISLENQTPREKEDKKRREKERKKDRGEPISIPKKDPSL